MKLQNILIQLAGLIVVLVLDGCSGCSQSGIRKRAERNAGQGTVAESPQPAQETFSNNESPSVKVPLNQLFRMYQPAVFMIFASDGEKEYQGTGFFISQDGIAVSSYHVFDGTVKGAGVIRTAGGNILHVEQILHENSEGDYIIFRVALTEDVYFTPIPIGKSIPEIGEDVFAIGNPYGLEHTLSTGIISGYRDGNRLIQTTAEITHGSSGGPLLNMQGEVIGITTSGMGEANLNFAVNITELNLEVIR